MNLLLFALLVLVVVALVCWIIQFLPFPPSMPGNIKQIAMGVVAAIGLIVILMAVLGGTTPIVFYNR
jgi:hypothetical protein